MYLHFRNKVQVGRPALYTSNVPTLQINPKPEHNKAVTHICREHSPLSLPSSSLMTAACGCAALSCSASPAVPGGPTSGAEVGSFSGEAGAAARNLGQDPGLPVAQPPLPLPPCSAGPLSQPQAGLPALYHPLQHLPAAGQSQLAPPDRPHAHCHHATGVSVYTQWSKEWGHRHADAEGSAALLCLCVYCSCAVACPEHINP